MLPVMIFFLFKTLSKFPYRSCFILGALGDKNQIIYQLLFFKVFVLRLFLETLFSVNLSGFSLSSWISVFHLRNH